MEQPSFDVEKLYDDEIAPLMTKIIELCKEHNMPMFATFLYANNVEHDDSRCCTSFLMPENRPIPQSMLNLQKYYYGAEPLLMRVRNKDGAVTEEHVIFP